MSLLDVARAGVTSALQIAAPFATLCRYAALTDPTYVDGQWSYNDVVVVDSVPVLFVVLSAAERLALDLTPEHRRAVINPADLPNVTPAASHVLQELTSATRQLWRVTMVEQAPQQLLWLLTCERYVAAWPLDAGALPL